MEDNWTRNRRAGSAARAGGRAVLVRDSKDVRRPHLGFAPGAWVGFVAYASQG
ncbi:DUF397 domain-containing protein [Streptomyces sp. NPDC058405]|uniref:DUF397 domain-containing protein n=1 Tax=Streptomyces sp. NPDC058405 TaxID=3346482 RepID=UPI003666BBBC